MINCQTPHNLFGKSYTVNIHEIENIIKDTLDEDISWYLQTRDNQKYELYQSYKNPVKTIVQTLQNLNPSIKIKKK